MLLPQNPLLNIQNNLNENILILAQIIEQNYGRRLKNKQFKFRATVHSVLCVPDAASQPIPENSWKLI